MEKDSSKKINWIVYLRVFATINVILVHISTHIVYQYGDISTFDWWVGNLYESMSRFPVPVFLMITGALYLPRDIQLKPFLLDRCKRIVPPFLFWSIIYITYNLLSEISKGADYSFLDVISFSYYELINKASFHLWYIYLLIGMYLLTPVLSRWIRNCTEKEIIYFLSIWFVTLFIGNEITYKYFPKINLTYFTGPIGYFVLGHYLFSRPLEKNKNIGKISWLFIIVGILVTAIGTYLVALKRGELNELFYDTLTPNIFLLAVGIFLLFKSKLHEKTTQVPRVIAFINKYSYGIYLSHILILTLISNAFGSKLLLNAPLIGIPAFSVLCLIISLSIVFLINKLPLGKYISG